MATDLSVTVALTQSPVPLPPPPPCSLCILIHKWHYKRDNQCACRSSSPLLCCISRSWDFQGYASCWITRSQQQYCSRSSGDIRVNPVTKFSLGSSLQQHRYSRFSLHKVAMSRWSTLGNPFELPRLTEQQDRLLWETYISLNGKGILSLHCVSIGWSHFLTFRFWYFWCILHGCNKILCPLLGIDCGAVHMLSSSDRTLVG